MADKRFKIESAPSHDLLKNEPDGDDSIPASQSNIVNVLNHPVTSGLFDNIILNGQQKMDQVNSKQSQNANDRVKKKSNVKLKSAKTSKDTMAQHTPIQMPGSNSSPADCVPKVASADSPPLFDTEIDNVIIQIDDDSAKTPSKTLAAFDSPNFNDSSASFDIQLNQGHIESLHSVSNISSNFEDDNRSDGVISSGDLLQTTEEFQESFEMDQFISDVYHKSVDEIISLQSALESRVDNLFTENKNIT